MVTLTHKHIDVAPFNVQYDVFLTFTVEQVESYNVEFID